eukprot:CAMPEP_0198729110 /NCGR_PEP_ID=MMETSP1475-20131203/14882_1 /TAXON_ID= ORGANISM="Unidentified sp., Strain CCMP1999" /NCGR_SAMPLE_ID=MMETSP1475 /ASSEMBLY_ACC=CAM_ASM_001111 /LENGTH=266 /DNA_ID=CAMNT_0044491679 /DNA_START=75 /DNA_END=875 /DNA_ORIENTATION=-
MMDRDEVLDEKPDFIPVGNVEFPDLKSLRREMSEKERARRDSVLARLQSERKLSTSSILNDKQFVPRVEEEVEEETPELPETAVQRVVGKFERGEADMTAKQREIARMASWKRDLDRVQVERLKRLEDEDIGSQEGLEEEGQESADSNTEKGGSSEGEEYHETEELQSAAVELDEATKKNIRKRRKELRKRQKHMLKLEKDAPTKHVPKQTLEEFEHNVEEFIMREAASSGEADVYDETKAEAVAVGTVGVADVVVTGSSEAAAVM